MVDDNDNEMENREEENVLKVFCNVEDLIKVFFGYGVLEL